MLWNLSNTLKQICPLTQAKEGIFSHTHPEHVNEHPGCEGKWYRWFSDCGHQSCNPAADTPVGSVRDGCKLLTSGEDSRSFLGLPCRLQHFHTFPFPAWLFPVLGARLISAASPSAKSGKKWMENRLLASAPRDKETCLDEFASDSSWWLQILKPVEERRLSS